MDFLSAISTCIKRHGMAPRGARVLLAVSGGRDSMAMLEALRRLKGSLGIELAVAHIDHGIRRSSGRDLEFVSGEAAKRGMPFYHRRINVPESAGKAGTGIEETARAMRYRALEKIAKARGFDRVATAHTASDQAETVLYRIVSGAGIKGLSGILPVLEGVIIRPLLSVTREDVDSFIGSQGIGFVEDETNLDTAFTRNRVRQNLLPLIRREFNPSADASLSRLAESARQISEHIEAEAVSACGKIVTSAVKGRSARIDRARFSALPEALKPAVLEMVTGRVSPDSRLDAVHILAMLDAANTTGAEVHLPGAVMSAGKNELVIARKRR